MQSKPQLKRTKTYKMSMNNLDALSCLYPSYIYSLIMGFAPFKIERKGPFVKVKHMKIYHVISTLFYALSICVLLGMSFTKVGFYQLQSPMQRFINFLYLSLVAGLMSVNVVFNKIHTTSLMKLLKKTYHIDTMIKNRGIKLNYKKIMYCTLIFCVGGATLHTSYIIFLVCIQTYKDIWFSGSVYFALNFAVSGLVCVSCSFHAFFSVIGHMFEKVLEHMENTLLKNFHLDLEIKSKSIVDTAILHQELCDIVRLANDVTSVQMLASFAVTFSVVTLQIYSMVTAFNIKKVDYNFVLSSLFCVIILLQEKLTLSLVARRCMGMMPKTKELLTKVLNLYINDKKICREVNAFSLQILHDQFEITAGSFFVIEPAIFLTAASAIATYIMLFVQADPYVDLYQSMKETVGAI